VAPRHGKTTGVYLAGFNASPFFNSMETARTKDTHETTPFESDAKTYSVGLNDGTMSLSGFYDVGAAGLGGDELLDALYASDNDFPATVFLDGGVVVGRACRMANVNQSSYTVSAAVGDMITTKADLTVDGGVRYGKCLNAKAPITGTVTGAACDYGVAAPTGDWVSGSNGFAHIHPTANTRSTNTEIKIQQSADNSIWVDHATVNVAAGNVTPLVVPTTGANLRYVRALITPVAGTGSATIIVAFARA
jgi:uncharacterized cupredoxin-like copper-binding protein